MLVPTRHTGILVIPGYGHFSLALALSKTIDGYAMPLALIVASLHQSFDWDVF